MKPPALVLAAALLAVVSMQPACRKSENGATGAAIDSVGADGVRLIRLTGNDQLQFNLTQISAAPGEKITIEMTNIGSMPKQAMAHNWLLLQSMPDAEVNAFAMAASTRPPDYLPDDQSKILAHTKMLGPKEKDTITITAPADPGNYPFVCSFPGHFTLMRGTLTVQAK